MRDEHKGAVCAYVAQCSLHFLAAVGGDVFNPQPADGPGGRAELFSQGLSGDYRAVDG
jgi:hypothetical protein